MQSNHDEIDPVALEENISAYLQAVDEERPKWSDEGVCNGFAFLAFRSEIYNKSDQYVKRLFELSTETEESLIRLGSVLMEYRAYLAKFSEDKAHQDALNKAIACFDKNTEQHEIALVRKKYFNKARRNAFNKIQDKHLLKKSCDYYNFIHCLLAAYYPGKYISLRRDENFVRQEEFLETLKLLPADGSQPTVKEVFNFAFNFTEKELIAFLKKALLYGDHVLISSTSHTVYVSIKEGEFTFYDPHPIVIKPADSKALVQVIEKEFFKENDRSVDYMPMAIHIFSDNQEIKRPKPETILEEIIKKRGKNHNLNQQAWDGSTALFIAAFDNCESVVEVLAKRGANVNLANRTESLTPAAIAAICDNAGVIKTLIKYKADLKKADRFGFTPLHIAVKHGFLNSVRILVEGKANLNLRNKEDDTPLMLAIRREQWNCAAYLYKQVNKKLVSRDIRMIRKSLKISSADMQAKLDPDSTLLHQGLFAARHNTHHPTQSIVSRPSP